MACWKSLYDRPLALLPRVGIPRIDNPLTLLFILSSCLIFLLESKTFPAKAGKALLALSIMGGWSLLHIVFSSLNATLFVDPMLFAILPCYFYILYLIISRAPEKLKFIQRFIIFFLICITVPAFIELLTGFQFVYADEAYSVDSGTLKGLFFNPNNLATTALCLSPAVLVFFLIYWEKQKRKPHLAGCCFSCWVSIICQCVTHGHYLLPDIVIALSGLPQQWLAFHFHAGCRCFAAVYDSA